MINFHGSGSMRFWYGGGLNGCEWVLKLEGGKDAMRQQCMSRMNCEDEDDKKPLSHKIFIQLIFIRK